jgi:large subunit ribosomal protein L32e
MMLMVKTKKENKIVKLKRKKKPRFNVPNLGFFKSVKARWRKPRGTHNKKRMKFKFMGASPKVGYKNSESVRGLHSSGRREVLVNNLGELKAIKDDKVLVRVAGSIGNKKRKLIEETAKSLKLEILNTRFNGQADGKSKSSDKSKPQQHQTVRQLKK